MLVQLHLAAPAKDACLLILMCPSYYHGTSSYCLYLGAVICPKRMSSHPDMVTPWAVCVLHGPMNSVAYGTVGRWVEGGVAMSICIIVFTQHQHENQRT